jgi:hypothetical protein
MSALCPGYGGLLPDGEHWEKGRATKGNACELAMAAETRADIIEFALEHEELTRRELAVKYTDEKQYFVSESSIYRLLKAEDLVTAPAHIVMKAANEYPGYNHAAQRTLANGLYLSEGPGLVLLVDHSRRLPLLSHRLEALRDDEGL